MCDIHYIFDVQGESVELLSTALKPLSDDGLQGSLGGVRFLVILNVDVDFEITG